VGHSIKRRKFVSVSDKQSVGRLCCYPNLFYLARLSAVSTWKAIHANKRTFGSLAFSLPQSICIEGRYDLCKLSLFVWRASTMWLFFIANFFCLRLALQIEGPKLVTLLNQTTPMYSIWPQSNLSFHHQVHLASKQESCRVFFCMVSAALTAYNLAKTGHANDAANCVTVGHNCWVHSNSLLARWLQWRCSSIDRGSPASVSNYAGWTLFWSQALLPFVFPPGAKVSWHSG
jgi:hypothetical protein